MRNINTLIPFKNSLAFIFIILFGMMHCQIGIHYTSILTGDTLSIHKDSVLVKLNYWNGNKLKAESMVYLVTDSIVTPKYPRITRRFFLTKERVTKALPHGNTIEFMDDIKKVTNYSLGKRQSTNYLDKENKPVSKERIPEDTVNIRCGSPSEYFYLIEGKKAKR